MSGDGFETGEARDPEPTHSEREHRSSSVGNIYFYVIFRRSSRAHVRIKQRQIQVHVMDRVGGCDKSSLSC